MKKLIRVNQIKEKFLDCKMSIFRISVFVYMYYTYETVHGKTNIITYAPIEDSDQFGHPLNQIRFFICPIKQTSSVTF